MTVNIVVGPPCAGKSTFVKANAESGHVLIDFDVLATAFGSDVRHQVTGSVREVAFAARSAAIERVLTGIDDDAWIIHTRPTPEQVRSYTDAGADFWLLDPGIDECLSRVESDTRPEGTVEAIERWYEHPPTIPQAPEGRNWRNARANLAALVSSAPI